MHSRIFQLSTEKINKNNYINETDYHDHWFVNSIADYVDESNREEDIDWLMSVISSRSSNFKYNNEDNSIIFEEGFKLDYFEKNIKVFKDSVSKITDDIFCGDKKDFDSLIYNIKSSIEDDFSFYIDSEDFGLSSIDNFIRDYMDYGVKYYIGGTVDYHC